MYNKALQILQQYWHYTAFRPTQEKVIKAVLEKKNTIALLPTGGGKSICFQVPTLAFDGVCIVISPLIALMQDQVSNLKEKGIKASLIPSGSSQNEIITLFDNIRFGNFKFLYISPERLQSRFIQDKIKQLNVSLIAIDEAHCISEWGHDFRPSYRNISILKELQPNTPIIALTATATEKVLQDISETLHINDSEIFKQSFYRENLAYQFVYTDDKLYKLRQIFTKTKGSAIVYVSSRNKTKQIASYLNANGFKASYYHAGLSSTEKQIAFEHWMNETTPIIVATNAFGMGIDKPNVRVIVHIDLPSSIENYVQEAGRGGRDGNKAFSVVLTNNSDKITALELLDKNLPTLDDIKLIHQKLYQHYQISLGEFTEESFAFDIAEFSNKYNFTPIKVHTTLQILHNNGIVNFETSFQASSLVQFLGKHYQVLNSNTQLKNFIPTLLRMYGGIFEQPTKIDEFYIAKKLNCTSWSVVYELERLAEQQIISYKKASGNSLLEFLVPREDDRAINNNKKNILSYLAQKKEKKKSLLQLVDNNAVCRSIQLLQYFNEASEYECGKCDVCLQNKPNTLKLEDILKLLHKHDKLSSKEICNLLHEKDANILILLRQLLAEEKIGLNQYQQYYIK